MNRSDVHSAIGFKMNLGQFEQGLKETIGQPSSLRPFVCEGSPLDCDVFIVGYNPATALGEDWWHYWQPGYGYRKAEWTEEYLRQRQGTVSRTRRRIEKIVTGLDSTRVLETNIDARPSRRMAEYPKPITAHIDYLTKTCSPKVIIAHGKPAVSYLRSRALDVTLIGCKHFIFLSDVRTAEIIDEARHALN